MGGKTGMGQSFLGMATGKISKRTERYISIKSASLVDIWHESYFRVSDSATYGICM